MDTKIRDIAFRLLTRREHSRHELKQKLLLRNFSPTLIKPVLDWLAEKDYQSDERFTALYIEKRIREGYGALKIQLELQARGVDKALIHRLLSHDDDFWLAQLAHLWQRKNFSSVQDKTSKESARQLRFLQTRGFSGEQIKRQLKRDLNAL